MSNTVNVRAGKFAHRLLFLAEPDEGFVAASLTARELAFAFCGYEECSGVDMAQKTGCRLHARAMVLGLSKMLVSGDLLAELSRRGVLFVRLSPKGVLLPSTWSVAPHWFRERPALVEWALLQESAAASAEATRRWEERV